MEDIFYEKNKKWFEKFYIQSLIERGVTLWAILNITYYAHAQDYNLSVEGILYSLFSVLPVSVSFGIMCLFFVFKWGYTAKTRFLVWIIEACFYMFIIKVFQSYTKPYHFAWLFHP